MAMTAQQMKDEFLRLQYDPTAIQRMVINNLDTEIVDPTNPFVYLMESLSVGVSAAMEKTEICTRRQYPVASQNQEELYPHMSDRDYVGRFSTPATTPFELYISKDELNNRMVYDETTRMHRLTLPRNTYFSVAGMQFSLQYPIEIRKLMHGGFQVVYNVDRPSPLQNLETNEVEWEWRSNGTTSEMLWMRFETQQFNIVTEKGSANAAVDFLSTVDFVDNFYYARVYTGTDDGGWTEIRTTHTDQVYDVLVPTAVLQVLDKQLKVRIPQIYMTQGLVMGMVRIDLYETKGPIDLYLGDYPKEAFIGTFFSTDKTDYTKFVAPLKHFQQLWPVATGYITGGGAPETFLKLRERVINNSVGPSDKPITGSQLSASIDSDGYGFATNVDNITDRALLATRGMPMPADTKLITPAASTIETIITTVDEALASGSVIDNGTAITITPKTLYENINGITKLVDDATVQSLLQLRPDMRALAVSAKNYLYTPFHYVLDWSKDEFDLRAYYLDNPEVITKTFRADNDRTLLQASTASYDIIQTETGYAIRLVTSSSKDFKELDDSMVHVQLAFIPAGEKDRAYVNGILVGKTDAGERAYVFDLSSNMNVDSNNNLGLSKFFLYSTEPRITGAGLVTEFDILYSVSSVMDVQWRPNTVDNALGLFLLPSRIAGVTHETLRVRFGYALKTLWTSARSSSGAEAFQVWDMDILAFYEENILDVDANGSAVVIDPVTGDATVKFLHHAGDPILDEEGVQKYLHRKGDIMLVNGEPVPIGDRYMSRHIDIFLIEGVYWFATDPAALTYRSDMTRAVVSWLVDKLASRDRQLLEQTRLYFHPETTLGVINALVGDGIIRNLAAGQSLNIELAVGEDVLNDKVLQQRLIDVTVTTVSAAFEGTTIAQNQITKALDAAYTGAVKSISVSGLGGDANYPIVTIIDETQRFSLRKRLAVQGDDRLIVQEDLKIKFIPHVVA